MNRSRIAVPLEEIPESPEDFFETVPVCGPYSITAELPDMDTVVRYQEKQGLPPHGYYRLVRHPYARQLEANFKKRYAFENAILYTSLNMALHECLEHISSTTTEKKVVVIGHSIGDARDIFDPRLHSIGLHPSYNRSSELPDPERLGPLHSILFCQWDPPSENQILWLDKIKALGIPVLLCLHDIPFSLALHPAVTFCLLCLAKREDPIRGGILMTNDQAEHDTLYNRNKKRGAVLSARDIAWCFGSDPGTLCEDHPEPTVTRILCQMENARHGSLYPSGMNAIATLFDILRKPGKNKIISVGHMYSDTHMLFTEIPWSHYPVETIILGAHEVDQLESHLDDSTMAVFVETITNPLNEVPNLPQIIAIAQAHGIPTIVDNTMASPMNCQPLEMGATAVIHSTTKYLSGTNTHGGGVTLTNDDRLAQELHHYQALWKNHLSIYEASQLEAQIISFEERMLRFNANGIAVAEYLEQQAEVELVHFSFLASNRWYDNAKTWLKGPGSVVSFELKNASLAAVSAFFDSPLIAIKKAPSLGSDESLICPYTLLTYYHYDDDYLAEIPLSRYLIRISVGSEKDLQPVLEALRNGLDAVAALA